VALTAGSRGQGSKCTWLLGGRRSAATRCVRVERLARHLRTCGATVLPELAACALACLQGTSLVGLARRSQPVAGLSGAVQAGRGVRVDGMLRRSRALRHQPEREQDQLTSASNVAPTSRDDPPSQARPPTRISGGGAKHGIREYGGVRNTEYGNTEGCEIRNTGIQRGSKHGIREYAGVRHIFCARATSGAAETAFPLRTAIEKQIFGLLSSSSIHWCKVCFLVDDFCFGRRFP
jgi:hypothetical protein